MRGLARRHRDRDGARRRGVHPRRPQPRARRWQAARRRRSARGAAPALEDEKVQKVTHNGHFDFLVLANHGVTMRGMRFDTMIAAYLLGEIEHVDPEPRVRPAEVEDPAADRHHRQGRARTSSRCPPIADGHGVQLTLPAGRCAVPGGETYSPASCSARNLWPLFDDVEMPLMRVLARMELTGVAVDPAPLVAMSREMQAELAGDRARDLRRRRPRVQHRLAAAALAGALRRARPAEDAQDQARATRPTPSSMERSAASIPSST